MLCTYNVNVSPWKHNNVYSLQLLLNNVENTNENAL
jgi:hypothetical protein